MATRRWCLARALLWDLGILLLVLLTELAHGIPEATPEEMGMDAAILGQMIAELEQLTAAGRIPGATVLISRRGRLVFKANVGFEREDMLFQIFSMSKVVVTVALFTLVQDGLVDLDDPIDKFIPEIRGSPRRVIEDRYSKPYWYKMKPTTQNMTVHHLLTHTAGLTYGWTNTTVDELYRRSFTKQYLTRSGTLENLILAILELPLLAEPGDLWYYSLSFDALGYILQRITGMPIDAVLDERVFKPLGMVDTGFYVPEDKRHRLAPMLDLTQPGSVISRIHKYIASDVFQDPVLKLPGTGLVTTPQDFFRLTQMLYNGGELGGRRFVRQDLVERIFQDQLPDKLKPYEINYEKKYNHGYSYGAQIQLVESSLAPKVSALAQGHETTVRAHVRPALTRPSSVLLRKHACTGRGVLGRARMHQIHDISRA
jgi:CubicO group peptidase (beta-lactamase class C family)